MVPWKVLISPARRARSSRDQNVPALIDDLAGRRRIEAADDVEGRGLAGAVRTDQAMDRARVDLEAEVLDGDDAAKDAAEITGLENWLRSGQAISLQLDHHVARHRVVLERVHREVLAVAGRLEPAMRHFVYQHEMVLTQVQP